jgi:PAS domain S-box-containing protein
MVLSPPLPMPSAALEDWGRTLASLGIGASLVDRNLKLSWCNQLLQEQVDEGRGDGGEHCFAVHWSRKQRCSDCLPLLVFQTGEPHQGYRERHRPGQPRKMFRVGATPIRDPAGQLTHVMETFVDVTELGAAIASARLEDRLSTSLAAAGHGVLVVDPRGRIVSWSTGMEAILGHRAIDVLGRGAASLLPGEAGGATFWSQTRRELRELVAKDGRRVPLALTPMGEPVTSPPT